MDEKRRQPAIIVAILALLGAASLPQVLRNQGGGTSPQAQEQADTATPQAAMPPAGEEKDPDRRDLKPLLDYLAYGDAKVDAEDKDLGGYINDRLKAIYGAGRPDVHCLVVTLPDPVSSVVSLRFDEYLDVVQRAVELQGFILDRSSLPWQPINRNAGGPQDRTSRLRFGNSAVGDHGRVHHAAGTEGRPSRPDRLQDLADERPAAPIPAAPSPPPPARLHRTREPHYRNR